MALAVHKLTQKQVAIKIIDKTKLNSNDYSKVQLEIQILSMMRHKNIIRLIDVLETTLQIYMIMEHAKGGDLLSFMKAQRMLSEDEARSLFRQVVNGVGHCHCRSVLHRDIKLNNLLLDANNQIKLCDFGISQIITSPDTLMTQPCGTPAYVAPEIISCKPYSGFKSDIWSLGIILFALCCGRLPFKGRSL